MPTFFTIMQNGYREWLQRMATEVHINEKGQFVSLCVTRQQTIIWSNFGKVKMTPDVTKTEWVHWNSLRDIVFISNLFLVGDPCILWHFVMEKCQYFHLAMLLGEYLGNRGVPQMAVPKGAVQHFVKAKTCNMCNFQHCFDSYNESSWFFPSTEWVT